MLLSFKAIQRCKDWNTEWLAINKQNRPFDNFLVSVMPSTEEESYHTWLFESQEIRGDQLWRREPFPAHPFLCASSLCSANGYIRGFEI